MTKERPGSSQLSLDFLHRPRFSREALIASPSNAAATALIDLWPRWPSALTVLVGPSNSGKSHLASIWSSRTRAEPVNIHDNEKSFFGAGPFLLEDVDSMPIDETALFHLINLVCQKNTFLLMTARNIPGTWNISLPDLASRLKIASIVRIQEPDDQLFHAVMTKLFEDRQISVPVHVVDYLVCRVERSLSAAILVVAWLDRLALERKTHITRALATEVVDFIENKLHDEEI